MLAILYQSNQLFGNRNTEFDHIGGSIGGLGANDVANVVFFIVGMIVHFGESLQFSLDNILQFLVFLSLRGWNG